MFAQYCIAKKELYSVPRIGAKRSKGKLLRRQTDNNKRENTASRKLDNFHHNNKRENTAPRKLDNFHRCLKVPAWG